jgi:hypothetical protein
VVRLALDRFLEQLAALDEQASKDGTRNQKRPHRGLRLASYDKLSSPKVAAG